MLNTNIVKPEAASITKLVKPLAKIRLMKYGLNFLSVKRSLFLGERKYEQSITTVSVEPMTVAKAAPAIPILRG